MQDLREEKVKKKCMSGIIKLGQCTETVYVLPCQSERDMSRTHSVSEQQLLLFICGLDGAVFCMRARKTMCQYVQKPKKSHTSTWKKAICDFLLEFKFSQFETAEQERLCEKNALC